MKQRLCLLIMLLCMMSGSYVRAQETQNDARWFVTLGVGGQLYWGDHDKQLDFGSHLSPSFDIAAGKWFRKEVGMRLMMSGFTANGATQDPKLSNGKPMNDKPQQGYWLDEQDLKFFTLHTDLLVNVSRFGNSDLGRWDLIPYVGFGWGHSWSKTVQNSMAVDAGFITSYRLNNHFALQLDLRGTLLGDKFDGERGDYGSDGITNVTFGVTYSF